MIIDVNIDRFDITVIVIVYIYNYICKPPFTFFLLNTFKHAFHHAGLSDLRYLKDIEHVV